MLKNGVKKCIKDRKKEKKWIKNDLRVILKPTTPSFGDLYMFVVHILVPPVCVFSRDQFKILNVGTFLIINNNKTKFDAYLCQLIVVS